MNDIFYLLITYKYIILFPIALIEGPMASVAAGFLAHQGYLNLAISYTIFILGDVLPDGLYYYSGKYGHKSKLFQKHRSKVEQFKYIWDRHGILAIVISKFAYGISPPLLMSAGLANISPRKFFSLSLSISFFQFAVFMTLGYYFGNSYSVIQKYMKGGQIVITFIFILFFIIYYASISYFGKDRKSVV